jgi:hypothetical protein
MLLTGCCLLSLLWPQATGTAIAREKPWPLAGHPGNLFVQGEKVTVAPPTAPGATGWRLLDYERRTVREGQGSPAALGELGVGYHELWALGAEGQPLAKTTLGVLAPLVAPTPQDSPIALDAATAWFYMPRGAQPATIDQAANQCALAGINWVRDRLSWAATEPQRGQLAERTVYDDTARLQAAEGLKVLQVFHSSPGWATRDGKRFCPDLRDVYRYLRAVSARWKGQVRAWEPWNEGDIDGFGGHSGMELAAWQKAAWWAIKAGDPGAVICHNVFATWNPAIMDDLTANESAVYCDTFNFHHYCGTDGYPALYEHMRRVAAGRPLWVSEAGTHVRWEGDAGEKEPAWGEQVKQARFVTQCLAASLAEGSAATFFFLLPNYAEGQIQFGLTHRDRTPRPGYLALAAAGRLLAGAKPLGRVLPGSAGSLRLAAFRAWPDGQERMVVVAWAAGASAPLPAWVKPQAAWDFLGRPLVPPAQVGADPVYLVLALDARPEVTPLPETKRTETRPCPLVLQPLLPKDRLNLGRSSWRLEVGKPSALPVWAYNFGDAPLKATVAAKADPALTITPASREVELAPGERVELAFTVQSAAQGLRAGVLPVSFAAPVGETPAAAPRSVAALRFEFPREQLAHEKTLAVVGADQPSAWRALVSPGKMTITAAEGGGVQVDAVMQAGDRWAYPILDVPAAERPAGFDGLTCTIVPLVGQATFRIIFDQANGANYLSDTGLKPPHALDKPFTATVLFADCAWGAWSKPDPNGKLDTGQLVSYKIGCNTGGEHVRYVIRDVRWVRLK